MDLLIWNSINYIWQETLDFLLQSEADLIKWNNYWSGNIDTLIAEISNYRQHKIKQSHVSLTLVEFTWLYKEDVRVALERLFIEPIHDCVIEKLEAAGMQSERIFKLRMEGKVDRLWGIFSYVVDLEAV